VFKDFEGLARNQYQSALNVHGDLVDYFAFQKHLKCIVDRSYRGREADLARFVRSLHTNDLMLALACSQGSNAAWQRFSALYRSYLAELSRRFSGRAFDPQETGDAIWIDLYLPDRSGQSRIASYNGQSSLATWLRVVVTNRIINQRMRKSSRFNDLDGITEPVDASAYKDLEARLRVERYSSMILTCFERASERVPPHDRRVLLLRYDQELQLGEIARLFSVHQSTITRQIDRTIGRLRNDLIDLLAIEYGLGPDAIEECLSVAVESLTTSVSILSLLKTVVERPSVDVSAR
jgi:RNA polymerase sigma-70 factor